MTASHSVQIIGEGPDARLQRAVLATVPNSYRIVDNDADVLLLSGRDGTAAATIEAIGEGTRGIFLTSPSFLSPHDRGKVAKVARDRGLHVMIGLVYAPCFQDGNGGAILASPDDTAIIDMNASLTSATADALREALLEQRIIARLLMGSATTLKLLQASADAVTVEAEGGTQKLRWRMTARSGIRNWLVVEQVSREQRTRVDMDAEPLGNPAHIATFDAAGSHIAMPVYQGGYRLSWLKLAAMLDGSDAAAGTMTLLEEDLASLPF